MVNLTADSKVIHQLRRCGDCQAEGTQCLADTMIPFKVLKELCALHGLAETAFTLERFDRAPDSCIFDVRMVLLEVARHTGADSVMTAVQGTVVEVAIHLSVVQDVFW